LGHWVNNASGGDHKPVCNAEGEISLRRSDLKYDFYSYKPNDKERKLTKSEVDNTFDEIELVKLVNGETIEKNNKKYWAEEAMNYSKGISVF
jgi:hypothetical protein